MGLSGGMCVAGGYTHSFSLQWGGSAMVFQFLRVPALVSQIVLDRGNSQMS